MNQRYDVIGFGLMFLGIAIFGVAIFNEAASQGVYVALREFQTSIVGAAALAFAYWAGKPVYDQLKEMRVQSAIATRETIRREISQLRHEMMLCDDIILEAAYSNQEDVYNAQRTMPPKMFYEIWHAEMLERVELLKSKNSDMRLSNAATISTAKVQLLRLNVLYEITCVLKEWHSARSSIIADYESHFHGPDSSRFTYTKITSALKLQNECYALQGALKAEHDRLTAILERAEAAI